MIKLTDMQSGQRAIVARIMGDGRYLSRVTSIGLNPGCPVEMMQNVKNRPILIYGRDTLIALNREESGRILVEVKES